MELSSPVASLVPGLVDNAVVTCGDRFHWSAAIPFRRVPVFASWAVVSGKGENAMARKGKARKTDGAVLPVMRPHAAGIDIGATLKVYPGAPHGLCTTHADQVNADLLAFLKS